MLMAAAALIKDSARTEFSLDGEHIAAPLFRRFSGERIASARSRSRTSAPTSSTPSFRRPAFRSVPEPEGGNGFKIERTYYTPDGELADIATVQQNDRFVVELIGDLGPLLRRPHHGGRSDPGRLRDREPEHLGERAAPRPTAGCRRTPRPTPRRAPTASWPRSTATTATRSSSASPTRCAPCRRACSPSPAATVEDMYRPELYARTGAGTVEVVGPTR